MQKSYLNYSSLFATFSALASVAACGNLGQLNGSFETETPAVSGPAIFKNFGPRWHGNCRDGP